MTNSLNIIWSLLAIIGRLPDELICKILYDFQGLEHPISLLLNKKTYVNSYFSNMPYVPRLLTYYRKNGYTKHLQNLLLNSQKEYANKYRLNSIIYQDLGYFIPRNFGKLYYELKNDNLLVEPGMDLKLWKLNRSKNIVLNKVCTDCNYSFKSLATNLFNNRYISWTEVLNKIEMLKCGLYHYPYQKIHFLDPSDY